MRNLIAKAGSKSLVISVFVVLAVPAVWGQSKGEKLYKDRCVACHAADGSGNSPAGKAMKVRDFKSPEVQKETDAELAEIITKGRNRMPKYGDKLKPVEIKDLVAYVRELSKKK
jgi:cytochrome c6